MKHEEIVKLDQFRKRIEVEPRYRKSQIKVRVFKMIEITDVKQLTSKAGGTSN